jgi:hypothetical protein
MKEKKNINDSFKNFIEDFEIKLNSNLKNEKIKISENFFIDLF